MDHPIPLECVAELSSTQDVLKVRAQAGAGEGALLARRQTGGRGRLGRRWETVDGNLHLSVLLRPAPPFAPGPWALLAAVALAESLARFLPGPGLLRLKWPNDVLLRGAKVAGILGDAGLDPAPWLVLGFGVNLAGAPPGLDRPTASLADLAPPPLPDAFAHVLLATLQTWRHRYEREGFGPIRDAWLALGPTPGDAIAAGTGTKRVEGRFRGIGPDGALLIGTPAGQAAVTSGEVE